MKSQLLILLCLLMIKTRSQNSSQEDRIRVIYNVNIETYFILERLAVEKLGHYGYIDAETDNSHQPLVKTGFEHFKTYRDSAIVEKTAFLLDTLKKMQVIMP